MESTRKERHAHLSRSKATIVSVFSLRTVSFASVTGTYPPISVQFITRVLPSAFVNEMIVLGLVLRCLISSSRFLFNCLSFMLIIIRPSTSYVQRKEEKNYDIKLFQLWADLSLIKVNDNLQSMIYLFDRWPRRRQKYLYKKMLILCKILKEKYQRRHMCIKKADELFG